MLNRPRPMAAAIRIPLRRLRDGHDRWAWPVVFGLQRWLLSSSHLHIAEKFKILIGGDGTTCSPVALSAQVAPQGQDRPLPNTAARPSRTCASTTAWEGFSTRLLHGRSLWGGGGVAGLGDRAAVAGIIWRRWPPIVALRHCGHDTVRRAVDVFMSWRFALVENPAAGLPAGAPADACLDGRAANLDPVAPARLRSPALLAVAGVCPWCRRHAKSLRDLRSWVPVAAGAVDSCPSEVAAHIHLGEELLDRHRGMLPRGAEPKNIEKACCAHGNSAIDDGLAADPRESRVVKLRACPTGDQRGRWCRCNTKKRRGRLDAHG